jgi:hypothetical protein
MIRDWRVGFAIMPTHESLLMAQAKAYEPLISNDYALEPQQLIDIERRPSCLTDGPPPALDSILRGPFSLDDVTGLGILEQKESSGARKQTTRNLVDGRARALGQIHLDKLVERRGVKNQRTKIGRAGQVIPDAVPC